MRTIGRLLRGLVALAVLVGVLVGVPALLATVGWPLPDHLPTLAELQRATSPGAATTDAVVKALVAVGWALWALVVVSSLVEAAAVLRHRQAPSLAAARPFQGLARWLVTSITLAVGSGMTVAAPVLAQPTSPPPAVVLALPSGAPPAQAAAPAAPAAPTYVVQRGDSLVGIAQAVLGDPERWPELLHLNQGAPQATGDSLQTAAVVRTGWVLQLPPDARVVADASPVALAEEDRVVRPGDNMWSIAEERVAAANGRAGGAASAGEVAPYWAQVVDTNAARVRSGDPNLIFPDEHLQLPAVAANGGATALAPSADPSRESTGNGTVRTITATPPTTATAPTAPPTTATPPTTAAQLTTATPTTAVAPSPPASVTRPGIVLAPSPTSNGTTPAPSTTVAAGDELRPSVSPAPVTAGTSAEEPAPPSSAPGRTVRSRGWEFPHVKLSGPGLAGAGLLAAGVVGALDRLLRARSRRGRARVVDPMLAGNELALRVGADPEAAAFLDLGLRAMAGALRDAKREPPEVVAVELGARQLEVILAEASTPAPSGFSTRDRGRRWVLPRRAERAQLEDLAENVPAPCPALVTVGRTAEGGWLLVDLEQAGATAIVGERAMAREVLAAATVELATSEWADFVRLVLVGFDMAGQERVQSVGSVSEVIEDLEREAAEIGALLDGASCSSTFEARVRGEAVDAWVPTVVLCAKPPPARQARRLAALATKAGNAGIGLLVAGPLDGAWELVAGDDDQLSVGVLDGAMVSAQHLSAQEAAAVDALFTQAEPLFVIDGADPSDQVIGDAGQWREEDELFFPDYLRAGGDAVDVDEDDELARSRPGVGPGPEPFADDVDADEHGDIVATNGTSPSAATVAVKRGPPPGLPAELADLGLLRGLDMLVGVMGPVEVWGAAKPFSRAKALELVVYLAMNPRSVVDAERLKDALWPGWELKDYPAGKRRPTDSTLNTTTTVARDCLGLGRTGLRLPHLQGNGTRRYGLEEVPLDYQLLRDAVERARAATRDGDRTATKAPLQEGLALVRGRPFENVRDDPRSYQWANVIGAIAAIEREIYEAAHWLAKLCLEDGDADGARWAARQGQLAVPGRRSLVWDEMEAAALDHNPAGVEGVMRELAEVLQADDPVDELDAHTVAVYKEQLANALRP